MVGKNSFGEKATPAMYTPLDLRSTEDHDNHLQNEADREPVFILCSGHTPVKSENSKTLVGIQEKMIQRFLRLRRRSPGGGDVTGVWKI